MRFRQSMFRVLAIGPLLLVANQGVGLAGTGLDEPVSLRDRVFFDRDALMTDVSALLALDLEGPRMVPLREEGSPRRTSEPIAAKRDRHIKVAALGPQKARPLIDAHQRPRPEPSAVRWALTPPVPPLLSKSAARGKAAESRLPVLVDLKARALEEALAARAGYVHGRILDRKKSVSERGRLPASRVPVEHMSTRWSDPLAALEPEEESARRAEFIMPFANGRVTSLFNQGRRHPAIDLAGALGSPVLCTTERQTVTFAGSRGGYGNAVITRDAYGRTHLYGHLKAITSRVGQVLIQGDKLGHLGSTGRSTGPHVHYEVRDRKGQHVDPVTLLFPGRPIAKGYAWADVWQEQGPARLATAKAAKSSVK